MLAKADWEGPLYNAQMCTVHLDLVGSESLATLTSSHPPTGLDQCSAATGSHR